MGSHSLGNADPPCGRELSPACLVPIILENDKRKGWGKTVSQQSSQRGSAATKAVPWPSWPCPSTGKRSCEKIDFADFGPLHFQQFTLWIAGQKPIFSQLQTPVSQEDAGNEKFLFKKQESTILQCGGSVVPLPPRFLTEKHKLRC